MRYAIYLFILILQEYIDCLWNEIPLLILVAMHINYDANIFITTE